MCCPYFVNIIFILLFVLFLYIINYFLKFASFCTMHPHVFGSAPIIKKRKSTRVDLQLLSGITIKNNRFYKVDIRLISGMICYTEELPFVLLRLPIYHLQTIKFKFLLQFKQNYIPIP